MGATNRAVTEVCHMCYRGYQNPVTCVTGDTVLTVAVCYMCYRSHCVTCVTGDMRALLQVFWPGGHTGRDCVTPGELCFILCYTLCFTLSAQE